MAVRNELKGSSANWNELDTMLDDLENTVDGPYPCTITNVLSNCTTDNNIASVTPNSSYSATITADTNYTLEGATVSVIMGGIDITSTAYSNGVITIASVTGDVRISISALSSGGNPAPIYLTGNFNNWNTSDVNYQFNYLSGSSGDAKLTTSLNAGNEFLVYANGNWYNSYYMTISDLAQSYFVGGQGNMICVQNGNFDIYFNAQSAMYQNTIYITLHS